jgi:hypothetical protein
MYLKDLARFPQLTAEEEHDLSVRARGGDQDAFRKLVESNLRFVVSMAKKYSRSGYPLHELINEYRTETQAMYPNAHFSAESTFYMESDIDNCDSQWTWLWWQEGVTDMRPYLYVVETERPNMNVDSSPLFAKYIFMDNLMMNAYPSKPGLMNGTAMIADYPAFAATIKRLSELRKKFLPFFTDGKNVGDCVLTKNVKGSRAGFYTLDDAVLGFAVLDEDSRTTTLTIDLTDYSDAPRFVLDIFDEAGNLLESHPVTPKTTVTLKGEPTELFVMRFKPAGRRA